MPDPAAHSRDAHDKRISVPATLGAALLASFLALPAGAGHLHGYANGSLYAVDLAPPEPVVHGPFLTDAFGNLRELVVLRDQPAALIRSTTHLYRVDLAAPLAPSIATSVPLPFPAADLIPGGVHDFTLLLGTGLQLAVIDNRTLAVRQTFTLASSRLGGELSPDGRSLFTWRTSQPHYHLSPFDPAGGPGAEIPLGAAFGNATVRSAAFSPNGRNLVLVENAYWFRPASPEGIPPQYDPFLNTYEIGAPGQAAWRESYQLDGDAVTELAFSRDGSRLFLAQAGNTDLAEDNRLLLYGVGAAGVLEAGAHVALTENGAGFSQLARAHGGQELYLTSPAGLQRYRPADGSLDSFPLSVGLFLADFETPSAVFADGFESGNSAAWDGEFP